MDCKRFAVKTSQTILDALRQMEGNNKGYLAVIDEENKVVGTVTDGDIRRSFIKGHGLNDKIDVAYYRNFEKIYIHDNFSKVVALFKQPRIKFIPIIDENQYLRNIITKSNMHVLLLQGINFDLEYDFLSLDDSLLEHEIYDRPWGFYKTTFLNDYSQSKIIKVNPSGALSLQEHKKREEYWIVITGIGEVILGESKKRIESGDFIYIPKGCKHRLTNTSDSESLMIAEVQLGNYFGEDDIIRYEDIYGRLQDDGHL